MGGQMLHRQLLILLESACDLKYIIAEIVEFFVKAIVGIDRFCVKSVRHQIAANPAVDIWLEANFLNDIESLLWKRPCSKET